jgi:hypothetical protein
MQSLRTLGHMERTALFKLIDKALDGQLEELLRSWARAGVSRRAAARLLTDALGGIEIAPETVRRWMAELDLDNGTEAA